MSLRGDYAALSYCWGVGQQPLVASRENLASHLVAIPENRIPKTIAEAVDVCRKLGIRYLWVDALCIVQGDISDKHAEISKMGSIYRNTTITILAACTKGVRDGFLAGVKPTKSDPPQLPLCIDKSSSGTIHLHCSSTRYSNREPLFGRAWALQEYLLSQRALIFESREVVYRCRTLGCKPVVANSDLYFNCDLIDLPAAVFDLPESKDYVDQERVWRNIVSEYSHRRLTLFEDRLTALAGIAALLTKIWGDVYLAGLWAKTLTAQLCWGVVGFNKNWIADTKHLDGRAPTPSWSWAAHLFPVDVWPLKEPEAKLVGSHVELVSQASPFGPVKQVLITLEARTMRYTQLNVKRPAGRNLRLDRNEDKEDLERCKLIYLGKLATRSPRKKFLVVKKVSEESFQRVGVLSVSIRCTGHDPEKAEAALFSPLRREMIVL